MTKSVASYLQPVVKKNIFKESKIPEKKKFNFSFIINFLGLTHGIGKLEVFMRLLIT